MLRFFCKFTAVFIVLVSLTITSGAEEVLFGTVARVKEGSNLVFITPAADRPLVAPEELLKFQSRIPGIDEVVESGRGYINGTAAGNIDAVVTEGEPAIGDEVVLLRGMYLNGSVTKDEKKWLRMSRADVQSAAGKTTPNVGALCVLARLYLRGPNTQENVNDAIILFNSAMSYGPSSDCAYEYAHKIYYGDQTGKPPAYQADKREGEKWALYSAENGNYNGMRLYASIMEYQRKYNEAEKWLRKAMTVEPSVLPGTAEKQLRRVQNKQRN